MDEFHLHGLWSESQGHGELPEGRALMCDVQNAVADGCASTEIYLTLKTHIRGVEHILIKCLVWQEEAEIVTGIEEVFHITIRAANQMISFLKLDGRTALWALLLNGKTHVTLAFLRTDCKRQSRAGFLSYNWDRPLGSVFHPPGVHTWNRIWHWAAGFCRN